GSASAPNMEMTMDRLARAGVTVARPSPTTWRVAPGSIHARDVVIEPDLSNAAPFLAAALVTGGEVTIPGWPAVTTQPGDALRDLLARLGGSGTVSDRRLTPRGA